MTTLLQATEFAGLIVASGGAITITWKGAKTMWRFGRIIERLAGNRDDEPGVLKRLDDLQRTVDDLAHGQVVLAQSFTEHVDGDAVKWKAEGEAWGHRIDARLDALELRSTQHPQDPPVGGSIVP